MPPPPSPQSSSDRDRDRERERDSDRELEDLKTKVLSDTLSEIRRELRIVRKRQHAMANSLQVISMKQAIQTARTATWGAAGAAAATVAGLIVEWIVRK